MVYISDDGKITENAPFSLVRWFWAIVNFFYLFINSLIDPNFSKHGKNYQRDFRSPGSGPPKPPSRKYHGFGPSGGGPAPPPPPGCGCGG